MKYALFRLAYEDHWERDSEWTEDLEWLEGLQRLCSYTTEIRQAI